MGTKIDKKILWSRQLIVEFQNICHSHGICMKLPGVNISESKVHYGLWEPGSKTLSISRHLIEDYPWPVVLEILKHEMAHQYVSEVIKGEEIHGPLFKEACQRLGVHPDFIRAGGAITSDMLIQDKDLSPRAGLMIRKIEKLLSLANSDNEHEARLASKKANDLIQKHNLDLFKDKDHGQKSRATYRVITHKRKRIESLQKSILGILRDFYFVDTVTSSIYDPHEGESFRSIVLFGLQENLEVAEYVYHYLLGTGKKFWKESRQRHGYQRGDKVSFDIGFVNGIRKTLEKSNPPEEPPAGIDKRFPAVTLNALINKENQIELNRVFPRLRKIAYGRHRKGAAYEKGYEKGEKTLIKKGIHHRRTGLPPLLNR
ncbi:DUF2786 domain-containing protein [Desulfospira joergensenii]|uniref:DUF2786 domain-containing protein n=1 Tax=Desulfospira joergensenii TaxID=53329 RepID=UPI0003B51907|nr:DUF2786 domain-containing protein [Desulfospira joergensenii]